MHANEGISRQDCVVRRTHSHGELSAALAFQPNFAPRNASHSAKASVDDATPSDSHDRANS
jgi:hypothetical protein